MPSTGKGAMDYTRRDYRERLRSRGSKTFGQLEARQGQLPIRCCSDAGAYTGATTRKGDYGQAVFAVLLPIGPGNDYEKVIVLFGIMGSLIHRSIADRHFDLGPCSTENTDSGYLYTFIANTLATVPRDKYYTLREKEFEKGKGTSSYSVFLGRQQTSLLLPPPKIPHTSAVYLENVPDVYSTICPSAVCSVLHLAR